MVILFSITATAQIATTSQEKPNILFILSDDHTSKAWGIYGGELEDYVQNANIKRLAAEGTVLNNAFCTNSICTPSRGSILTGQYSHVNQVYTLNEPLPKGHPNIAKTLSKNGYQTAVIGKWHLVGQPEGFDYFNVLPGQGRGEAFGKIWKAKRQQIGENNLYYRYWLHHPERPAHFGIRNERYKLAFFYGQDLDKKGTSKTTTEPAWEFYDLQEDPKELHNAIEEEQYISIIQEMKIALIEERKKYKDLDQDYAVMQEILNKEFK
ncbi:N-acetylgalactosamine-6-sulfatase [Nymphon striatum]|nr:N-acetylgalactosamine-6-sulfatase [Nymphon striatum]